MREMNGNLWDLSKGHLLCITTNGYTKVNGELVMGRGIAKEAIEKFPEFSYVLGRMIRSLSTNRVLYVGEFGDYSIISFPVKPKYGIYDGTNVVSHMKKHFKVGDKVPGWACKADINIIETSCIELAALTIGEDRSIYLPRMGAGAGELDWNVVKEIASKYLDDRYIAVTF